MDTGELGSDTGELGNGYKGVRIGYRGASWLLNETAHPENGWAIFCQIRLHAPGGSFLL